MMAILLAASGAGGWRGIVPMHSTREDVHRLLGPSTGESSVYKLKDVVVSIDYADGLPCEKCWPYAKQPRDFESPLS